MLKFLIVTLLAIQCNCQNVIEIGGESPRSVRIASSGPVVSGVSSLRTIGGISSFGAQPYGTVLSPASYGYGLGLSSIGAPSSYGLGLSTIGGLRQSVYGLGQVAVRPAVNYFSAVQPAVQQIAVAQPAVQTVAVRPAVQTVAVAQPAVYSAGVQAQQQIVPVSAAVQQVGRTVEYRAHAYNDQPIVPQVVEVEPSDIPLQIHFKSRSSTIQLSQEHIPGQPGTVEQTSSQDEPSKVIHEVVKPVIQEVREVIQPYRQLSQEIQPVVENVHTIVAKGEGERTQFVAQPYIAGRVQTIAQPVAQYQSVVQPVAQYQSVVQPVAQYQSVAAVAQPVARVAAISQPVVSSYQVAQPVVSSYQVAQPVVSSYQVAQPVGFAQSYRSVVQPAQSVYAVQQPSVSVYGSGSLLNSGAFSSRLGGLLNVQRSQPIQGSVSYSRTYAENERK